MLHGADMQFRGQTHLIRIAIPVADVTREELQALFEEAYFARFQVRLPEIRAVLVNLVTSVIGRRAAFPDGGADRCGPRARVDRRRHRRARAVTRDGAGATAPVFDRDQAAGRTRASQGRPSSSSSMRRR